MIENMIITVKKIKNAVTNNPTKRLADMTATEHITKSTITVISNNTEAMPPAILTAIGSFLSVGILSSKQANISRINSRNNSKMISKINFTAKLLQKTHIQTGKVQSLYYRSSAML